MWYCITVWTLILFVNSFRMCMTGNREYRLVKYDECWVPVYCGWRLGSSTITHISGSAPTYITFLSVSTVAALSWTKYKLRSFSVQVRCFKLNFMIMNVVVISYNVFSSIVLMLVTKFSRTRWNWFCFNTCNMRILATTSNYSWKLILCSSLHKYFMKLA